MKIAIVSGSRSAQPMGFGLAERCLVEGLLSDPDGLTIELNVAGGRSARRYARTVSARWRATRPGRMPRRLSRSADLVHLTGLDIRAPSRLPYVATVQDLAPLRFSDEGSLPPWTHELVRHASRLIAPSRFTAGELRDLLGVPEDRIRVVPLAVGHPVGTATPRLSADELSALGLRDPFVLRLGGFTTRKNLPRALAAWPAVRDRTGATLALAGAPHPSRTAQLAEAPSLEGVVALDYLPRELIPGLVRSARILLSTSTYEGFGLPPLEAMSAGTPVVGVRAGAVEEVCGSAAFLVEDDEEALGAALVRVLEDAGLHENLRSAGLRRASAFSWDRAARQTLAVYRELEGASTRQR